MKFLDIPQLTHGGSYNINVHWTEVQYWIERQQERQNLDINPDFQRAHVWTEDKQVAYVEHVLQGGATRGNVNIIRFNCGGWQRDYKGDMVLVDGKQRLEAVRRFMNNEIKAFGHYFKEFEGPVPNYCEFIFSVNDLPDRRSVLRWYLEINSGGVIHTEEELDRVQVLLEAEDVA